MEPTAELILPHRITRILAHATTFESSATSLLQAICDALDCHSGAWWQPAENSVALHRTLTWQRPSLTRVFEPAPELAEQAWATRQPAASSTSKAFAFPIDAGGDPFGVIECVGGSPRVLDDALLQLLEVVGGQIAQFIARNRSAARPAPAILTVDESGVILSANQDIEPIFGYAPEEITGRSVQSILPEFPKPGALHKHGHELQVEVTLAGTAVIIRDAEPRTETDAMIGLTLDGRITAWTLGAARLFQYEPEEAIGQDMQILAPPEVSDPLRGILERLRCGETVEPVSAVRMRKDRTRVHCSFKFSPMVGADGVVQGASAIAREATARLESQEALEESERRYRLLFEDNPQPMWVFDRPTLKFLAVNNAAVQTYGYTQEEFLSMTLGDIRPAEDVPRLMAATKALIAEYKRAGMWRHRKKDGTIINVEIVEHPVRFGERSAVLAMPTDVTERSRLREVERANRLKSEFLASMSHELRTPLNAIIGFSDLMAEQGPGPLNSKQERFVGHILQAARHLLALINDILDLSKIEAGRIELNREQIAVSAALSDVLATVRPLANTKGLLLESSVGAEMTAHADPLRFKQIIYNLLSNAVKFTPAGGCISVHCVEQGRSLCISVSDTGIGIPLGEQSAIFDAFHQAGPTTKGVKEGTGLGLAITKRLVEDHGGRIWAESVPGKGTCITFTVPAGKSQDTPVRPRIKRERPLILVVDDEAPAQELLVSWLQPEGYQTVTAGSSAEALAKAEELRPDAITLNMLTPGKAGWGTLYELKRGSATAGIPIIIVTIVDEPKVGLALGAAEYLVKPVDRPVLLEAVRRHVGDSAGSAAKVLVIDDEANTRDLLRETLESAGYQPLMASNGRQALESLSQVSVNAILLDLMMPEMDGFTFLIRLRENTAWQSIPVFVLTAKELTGSEIELLQQETRGLFRKGWKWKDQILSELDRVVQRGAATP